MLILHQNKRCQFDVFYYWHFRRRFRVLAVRYGDSFCAETKIYGERWTAWQQSIARSSVSIRVPLRRAERSVRPSMAPSGWSCFNPRPAPKSGTIISASLSALASAFQSASRSEERNDSATLSERRMVNVSIRVPLRRAERFFASTSLGGVLLFQSASRSEERNDGRLRLVLQLDCCFNPRPAPKSGTMAKSGLTTWATPVSIRVPLRRAER